MSEDPTILNSHAETESLPPDLAAVAARLSRDGMAWQQDLPPTTRLATYVTSRVPRDVAAHPPITRQEGHHPMDMQPDVTPLEKRPARYRRSFPIAAAILLVLLSVGYFGLQALHRQPNAGAHKTPLATATVAPQTRWFALTQIAYVHEATTPLDSIVLEATVVSPQTILAHVTIDPTKTHAGDTLTLSWEVNGEPLTGIICCHAQLMPHQDSMDLAAPLAAAGTGSVKVYYNNTILTETITFTVVVNDSFSLTPTPTPANTPTPLPCTRSALTTHSELPTPAPCNQVPVTPTVAPCTPSALMVRSDGPTPTPIPCNHVPVTPTVSPQH